MGAIVSHKKTPIQATTQQKAFAVAAFTSKNKTSGNLQYGRAGSLQGPREQVVTKVPRGGGEVEQPAPPNENGHVVAPSETAALKIQSSYRGFQARKELEKERAACISIQRKFREYRSKRGDSVVSKPPVTSEEETEEEEQRGKTKNQSRPWRESTTKAPVLDTDVKIGEKTKESFNQYQDDITDLKWQTEQQLERTLMGADYAPQRVVLIASNVPRADVLAQIVHKDVIKICYDFTEASLQDLTDEIFQRLEEYKPGSKAQSIGLVCKGGPGFFNPVKMKVITKAKVKKDEDINCFWKTVGRHMSKLDAENCKIHIIGNNVAGNTKGEKLLKYLSKAMKPSLASVESPLELSSKGGEMLQLYFELAKYRIWKSKMHSKVSFVI